jgi:hypothetical protein
MLYLLLPDLRDAFVASGWIHIETLGIKNKPPLKFIENIGSQQSMVECQESARSTPLRQGVSSRKAEFHLALA